MYEVVFTRLDDQWRELQAATGQLVMRVLVAGVMLAIFAVGLVHAGWPSRWFGLPYAVALACFTVTGVVAQRALGVEFEDFRPQIIGLATMPESFDNSVLEKWIDGGALQTIERNDARVATQRRRVRIVTALFAGQLATTLVTLAVRFIAF